MNLPHWLFWPIEFGRWWLADPNRAAWLLVIVPCAIAGFCIDRVCAALESDYGPWYNECFGSALVVFLFGTIGLVLSIALPYVLIAAWFGSPLVAAGISFDHWARRRFTPPPPEIQEAREEIERLLAP